MSKKNKFLLLSVLTVSFFSSVPVFADEVINNSKETPVNIEIIESPIRLSTVKAPVFGTYYQSNRVQTIKATGDLVIEVIDQRKARDTPWKLNYGISTFINDEEYNLKMSIGRGESYSKSGQKLADTSKSITVTNGNLKELVEAYSTDEEQFTYRVKKNEISIELPANLPTGKFVGKQKVTLINIPNIN